MARVTEQIAALTGASPAEVIFTSGATEANNLAIKGLAQASAGTWGRHILSTPAGALLGGGQSDRPAGAGLGDRPAGRRTGRGRWTRRTAAGAAAAGHGARCPSVAVDSELGTVQPVEEVAGAVKGVTIRTADLHVDATQAVGRIPVRFTGMRHHEPCACTSSAGICGSGVLLKRQGRRPLEPLLHGGTSTTHLPQRHARTRPWRQRRRRPCSRACGEREERTVPVVSAPQRAAGGTVCGVYPQVRINSPAGAVPHILNLSVEGVRGSRVPAGAVGPGRVRVGQSPPARLTGCPPGRCSPSAGTGATPCPLAHQPEPPDHRGGDRRISDRFRRVLARSSPAREAGRSAL